MPWRKISFTICVQQAQFCDDSPACPGWRPDFHAIYSSLVRMKSRGMLIPLFHLFVSRNLSCNQSLSPMKRRYCVFAWHLVQHSPVTHCKFKEQKLCVGSKHKDKASSKTHMSEAVLMSHRVGAMGRGDT